MNYQKLKNKIKLGMVAGAVLISSFLGAATYANELYPGHEYVPKISGMPIFVISKIDLTNNELELSLKNEAEAYESEIKNVSVGMITDRATLRTKDVLSFNSTKDTGSREIFSSGETPFLEFFSGSNEEYRKYTVTPEVPLTEDNVGILLYIVELNDGTKWVNIADYWECGAYWFYGMTCNMLGYMPGSDVNNVGYQMFSTEVKNPPAPVEEQTAELEEPIAEPEESTSEPDALLTELEASTEESAVDQATENQEIENIEVVIEPDTEVATLAIVSKTAGVALESSDDESQDEEIEDFEVDEGSGDTMLNVPLLGQTESKTEFNWLPYFIGGATIGTTSTCFLFYILKKKNRTHII
jgi:hypothetical protein